jgi:hypothetical protein
MAIFIAYFQILWNPTTFLCNDLPLYGINFPRMIYTNGMGNGCVVLFLPATIVGKWVACKQRSHIVSREALGPGPDGFSLENLAAHCDRRSQVQPWTLPLLRNLVWDSALKHFCRLISTMLTAWRTFHCHVEGNVSDPGAPDEGNGEDGAVRGATADRSSSKTAGNVRNADSVGNPV